MAAATWVTCRATAGSFAEAVCGFGAGTYQINSNTSASAFVSHFLKGAPGETTFVFDPMAGSPEVPLESHFCALSLHEQP